MHVLSLSFRIKSKFDMQRYKTTLLETLSETVLGQFWENLVKNVRDGQFQDSLMSNFSNNFRESFRENLGNSFKPILRKIL